MAFSFVGVMPSIGMKVEAAGTADSIISVASNEIGNGLSKYTKEMGMINNSYTYAWCAAFVSWCGAHSGSSDVISKTASCYNQYYNSSGARHWVVNDKSYKPVKGDLIYFDWNATGAKNSNFDHVGIVVSYNASTNKITTIEGNYGNSGSANNKVVKTTRDYNNKVKCFLTPKYSNSNLPSASYIHCSAGTNYTPTSIWWEKSDRTTDYDVKIWRNKLWEGDAYKILWSMKGLECKVELPSGYYEAYVESRNSQGSTMSQNVIKFTVQDGNPVDLGTNFYAYIINTAIWKPLNNDSYNVCIRDENGAASQVWKFERQGDKSYKIINCKDNNVLDVHNFGTTNGTNVAVCGSNDTNAQRWFIYGEPASFYLKAKCGNLVLDVNGGSSDNGTNVQMWTLNYSAAQKFQIYQLNKAGASTLSVTSGTSYTNTKLSWTKSNDTTKYVIKIWKNKAWEGNTFKEYSTTDTAWNITLPEGTYQAYVDSCNNYSYTCSNVVTFKVEKGICSHTWGNWTTTKNATCTADGQKIRKCSVCGKTETSAIAKTGHKYESKVIAPTCTAKGYTLYTCSICKNSYKDKYTNEIAHKWTDWTTSKNATCTADGQKIRKCSVCGKTETSAIAKTGHKYESKVIAPTCTAKGYTLYTCSICKNSYKDKYINAKGHSFECKDENGSKIYTCSGCQFSYSVTFKGEGTEASPYLIANKNDLLCLSELMQKETTALLFRSKHYLQTNDIDLQNMEWIPLGVFYVNDNATGMYFEEGFVYDGGNHNIFNLNVNGGRVFAGLFGKVNNGTIKNLSVYGNVNSTTKENNCATGGIVGELGYTGKVINCSFIGNVTGLNNSGGIVGKMWRGGTIENCYSRGNIEGVRHAGGIAAFMHQSDQTYTINYIIKNCYFAGTVKNENGGGICGAWISEGKSSGNDTEKIENCYYLKSSAEKGLGSGSITKDDSTALISPMLKQISEDLGSSFAEKTYDSVNKGYPVFTWQTPSKVKGDIDNNGNVNVSDAVTVQKCLTGKCMVTDGQYVTADMNDDGMVNVFDMILVRRTLGIK